jgi:hypothetical protein
MERGNGVELNHDSLMGVILIAAGVLTFLYTRNPTDTLVIRLARGGRVGDHRRAPLVPDAWANSSA